jgi:hypothetical protein
MIQIYVYDMIQISVYMIQNTAYTVSSSTAVDLVIRYQACKNTAVWGFYKNTFQVLYARPSLKMEYINFITPKKLKSSIGFIYT